MDVGRGPVGRVRPPQRFRLRRDRRRYAVTAASISTSVPFTVPRLRNVRSSVEDRHVLLHIADPLGRHIVLLLLLLLLLLLS